MAVFIYVAVIATLYPLVIFLQPYLMLPALLFIGIPPAFGYAMFKHRLMDVTVIVKRSLIYGAITATIAAVYLDSCSAWGVCWDWCSMKRTTSSFR